MNRKSTLFTLVVVLAVTLSASVRVADAQTVSSAGIAHSGPGKLALTAAPVSAPREKIVNGAEAALTFQRLWFYIDNNTDGASIAIDAAGGVHMGFSAHTSVGGAWPAYYAYCASDCANSAGWTTTSVGNLGIWGGYTRLALDAAGHPRLLWFSETSISNPGVYQYAGCNTGCTNPANWATVSLTTSFTNPSNNHYFALDPQGHPRYIYTSADTDHTGTYYVFCDSDCGVSVGNWYEAQISSAYFLYDFSLMFTTTGGARLAYRDGTASQDTLSYAECDANCDNAANWKSISLYNIGSGNTFSLRLDAQNRPRLAYYTGYLGSGDPNNNVLVYAWCDTACTLASNWDHYALGLPANYGEYVDLALDQSKRPHLAYYVDDVSHSAYGLGYAECSANCETHTATWQDQFVETSNELDASDPVPIKSGCSVSSWLEVGQRPSLTLDAAGNPRIGYTAKHYQGGTCSISEDIRLVRFALAGSATPPGPTPLASVALTGPTIGAVNISNTFTATVSPITATTPITYVWQATGQTQQVHTGRGASDTISFTWSSGVTGTKSITVTASNANGAATGYHAIVISQPGVTTPVANVTLSGPVTGAVGLGYTFAATVGPITATQPITYIWQATEQTVQTHTGRGANDTINFTWSTSGTKTITVTASNAAGGPVSNSHSITLHTIQYNHWVYLPAILKY